MLEHLHKYLPGCRIDILVRAGNEALFSNHPYLGKVLAWNKRANKYRNLFRLIGDVRKEKYDSVINVQRHTASALITVFAGAKQTSGFDENFLSRFFTYRTKHRLGNAGESNYVHEVQRCIALVKEGIPEEICKPKLYPSPNDYAAVQQHVDEPFITISPSSVWMTKQTPIAVWQKLIEASQQNVYLLGASSDVALCESLAKGHAHVTVLAGQLSLLQSAALMSKAQMNYTNDSAPLHLCSAMDAPVTAVFCSTIPEFGFGPLSKNSRIVQTHEQLSCRPCGIHGQATCPMGHFKCGKIELQDLL